MCFAYIYIYTLLDEQSIQRFVGRFGEVFLEVCDIISCGIGEVFGRKIKENHPEQILNTYIR